MIKVLKTLWLDLFKEVRAGETGPYPHLCVLRGLGPRPQTVAGEQARGWEMQPRLVARAPLLFWGGSWCLSLGAGAFGQLVGSSASTLSLGLQDPVVELLAPPGALWKSQRDQLVLSLPTSECPPTLRPTPSPHLSRLVSSCLISFIKRKITTQERQPGETQLTRAGQHLRYRGAAAGQGGRALADRGCPGHG